MSKESGCERGNAITVGPPSNPTKSYARAVLTGVANGSRDEIDDNPSHGEQYKSKDMAIGAGDRCKRVAIATEDYVMHRARSTVPYIQRNKLYNDVYRSPPRRCEEIEGELRWSNRRCEYIIFVDNIPDHL
ncbi:hypothetical protein U1Q18_049049 [Sarracenia purpurea var. burkii]